MNKVENIKKIEYRTFEDMSICIRKNMYKLKEDFDLIVFDAPPTLSVADAQILSNKMDGTVLVIDAGYTEKEAITKAKELLEQADAKILGVVLNNYTSSSGEYYEYYGE